MLKSNIAHKEHSRCCEHKPLLMSEIKSKWEGKGIPAAILGAGPSLPGDIAKLPDHCVMISVNYHALKIVRCPFMVYNDQPENDPEMLEAIKDPSVIKVSPEPTSDILFDVDVWTGFYSSNTAAWFALWIGMDPVILCGMDCYQGDRVYFHPTDRDAPNFHYPLDHHIRPWVEDGRNLLPHVERLKVMSGPLVNVFGRYTPSQPPPFSRKENRGGVRRKYEKISA